MMDNVISVFAKTDSKGRIVEVSSSTFLENDSEHLVKIDQSDSNSRSNEEAYSLSQGLYFDGGLINSDGTHRYIYTSECSPSYREATTEEIEAELEEIEASRPLSALSLEEKIDLIGMQLSALMLESMSKSQTVEAIGAQLAQVSLEVMELKST